MIIQNSILNIIHSYIFQHHLKIIFFNKIQIYSFKFMVEAGSGSGKFMVCGWCMVLPAKKSNHIQKSNEIKENQISTSIRYSRHLKLQ